jgi:hypothetical protein
MMVGSSSASSSDFGKMVEEYGDVGEAPMGALSDA